MSVLAKGLLLSVITGVSWGSLGILFSTLVKKKVHYQTFMFMVALFTMLWAWLFMTSPKQFFAGELFRLKDLIPIMAMAGVFAVLGFEFMQRGMQYGNHAIVWALGQSALIFPALSSVIIWDEKMGGAQFLGLAAIIGSVGLFAKQKDRISDHHNPQKKIWLLYALLALLSLGMLQTFSSAPSHWKGWKDTGGLREPILQTSKFAVYIAYLSFLRRWPGLGQVFWAAMYSGVAIIGKILLYLSLDTLSQVNMVYAVFPIAICVSMVFMTLYSILFLKEKSSHWAKLGLGLAIAGMGLISLR